MLTIKTHPAVATGLAVALMAVTLLGTACHHKRKPVIVGANLPGSSAPAGESASSAPGEPTGDIRTFDTDVPSGSEIPGLMPEGGPLADVFFEFDSASLTPAAEALLRSHAAWLRDRPTLRVVLEGHCDERGTVDYNLALGQQRARAVYDYLHNLGIPGERLSTVSFGKERPLVAGHDESAWAKNRRVHCAVTR